MSGRTTFENNPYPQGDYLREAFNIASSISNKEVLDDGFQGIEIRDELKKRRTQILAQWKAAQEPAI